MSCRQFTSHKLSLPLLGTWRVWEEEGALEQGFMAIPGRAHTQTSDEGLTLETLALKIFAVTDLRYQLS